MSTLINQTNFPKGTRVSLSKEFKVAASDKGAGFTYHWCIIGNTPYLGGKRFEEALQKEGLTALSTLLEGDNAAKNVLLQGNWEIAPAMSGSDEEASQLTTADGVPIFRIQKATHCVELW